MKYLVVIFILQSSIFFCSCNEPQSKFNQIAYYENGVIKRLIIEENQNKKLQTEYNFYENGEIKSIRRFEKNLTVQGEQLWFFEDGQLDQKNFYKDGKSEGNAYYFYDTTGALKNFRFFKSSSNFALNRLSV